MRLPSGKSLLDKAEVASILSTVTPEDAMTITALQTACDMAVEGLDELVAEIDQHYPTKAQMAVNPHWNAQQDAKTHELLKRLLKRRNDWLRNTGVFREDHSDVATH